MRESLIILLDEADAAQVQKDPRTMREFYGYIADYLLEHGVTILPCKIGDTLYSIWQDDDGEYQISEDEIFDVSAKMIWVNGGGFDINSLGKSDFLTREEAKKEIERRTAQNGLAYATPNFELLEG